MAKLTVEDKLKIRALYRQGKTQEEIAEIYGKNRVTINKVCNDETIDPIEAKVIDKEITQVGNSILKRMKVIHSDLLLKIETAIGADKISIKEVTSLLKEFNAQIALLENRPTQISESRKLTANIADIMALPKEQRVEFLLRQ